MVDHDSEAPDGRADSVGINNCFQPGSELEIMGNRRRARAVAGSMIMMPARRRGRRSPLRLPGPGPGPGAVSWQAGTCRGENFKFK